MTSRSPRRRILATLVAAGASAAAVAAAATGAGVAQAAPSPQVPAHYVPPNFSRTAARVGNAGSPVQRADLIRSVASPVLSSVSRQGSSHAGAASVTRPGEIPAYDVLPLWNRGITGSGTTVAVIESFGDPDIQKVIDRYDKRSGLPPADVSILHPVGAVPTCTPALNKQIHCNSWIGETDLDVAMVHTLAPGAHILVTATPVNETEGFTGLPEMMLAIDYLTEHRLTDVISMSLGTTEENFPSLASIKTLDPAFRRAKAAGIPVTASSGDDGAASELPDGQNGVYPFRAVGFPADDPLVTAVGGTVLHLNAQGQRTAPDSLVYFSGAGHSKTYARPTYQDDVASIVGSNHRALPDITMEGIYGTSQSSPLFAAVLALATQVNRHRPLGNVDAALYKIGPKGTAAGIVDVTKGNNSYGGVKGFSAGKGFDIASGWGTVDAKNFVPALVKALR